ncbi:unnamed protein product [Sphenostylis stenocarpa]|uniref:RRM domain-containing protein n=1 Tax=Sphenostylis stenocarpa TaxID=92480 RepID=A0AA86SL65_9FABA|nr:unnamed protein product [Sphenostylis stenocarpa]
MSALAKTNMAEASPSHLLYGVSFLDRGGGRDRFRRDYPSRYEDNKGNGVNGRDNRNSNNPPSRHLWAGNLSHNIVEEELAHHFLRFGPLENVAFQPGRSYAFINFRRDEDAIDAMRALQGFPLAGNPLRIEFAKAVSVAHLFLLVTFPSHYITLQLKSSSVQFI